MTDDTPTVPALASRSGEDHAKAAATVAFALNTPGMRISNRTLNVYLCYAALSRDSGKDHAPFDDLLVELQIRATPGSWAEQAHKVISEYAALLSRDSGEAVKLARAIISDHAHRPPGERSVIVAEALVALSASAARLTEERDSIAAECKSAKERMWENGHALEAMTEDNKRLRAGIEMFLSDRDAAPFQQKIEPPAIRHLRSLRSHHLRSRRG